MQFQQNATKEVPSLFPNLMEFKLLFIGYFRSPPQYILEGFPKEVILQGSEFIT